MSNTDHLEHDESAEREEQRAQATAPAQVMTPFSAKVLRRQLAGDVILRLAMALGIVAGFVAALRWRADSQLVSTLALVALFATWLAVHAISSRTSQQLPFISALLDRDPSGAEAAIAEQMRKRPLLAWVRLLLYHRLAVLRHRQQRFAESAAICTAILGRRLGPAGDIRAHLLLMLAEAQLQCGHMPGTYAALEQLYRTRLTLLEALQRLALQTRYELTIGRDDAVLNQLDQKVQFAELMPAPQAGMMHAMLAQAATRTGQAPLARWLKQRAELLCTKEHLAHLANGGLAPATTNVTT
jgi:hypothetical protein